MKKLAVFFLERFDKFVVRCAGWSHIPNSKTNFFYLTPHIYKGKTIKLKDGTFIRKGDWVAELHIDNISIKTLNVSYQGILKLFREELITLKQSFNAEPYSKVKAIHGISVFYNIARRQGFTIIDVDNIFKRVFESIWENILRLLLKKYNKKTRKKFVGSKECWISKDQIMIMN
ncbi:YkoP family protein [Clostridium sp. DJ247]|uniref:YkoP family protein n=1 Tax=Clostridium sp. DJ247 TaxID=2726188 RepID=UPI0016285D25|nr:hypothetical protein [Clostridium sp. DJ247]MBC2582318.1 hypothetical protein [Clostridium sp. DJ247]